MRSPMRSPMHFATRACLHVCSPSFGPALESECAPVRARSRSPAPAPPCHCARAAADVLPSENYRTHPPADARLLPPCAHAAADILPSENHLTHPPAGAGARCFPHAHLLARSCACAPLPAPSGLLYVRAHAPTSARAPFCVRTRSQAPYNNHKEKDQNARGKEKGESRA